MGLKNKLLIFVLKNYIFIFLCIKFIVFFVTKELLEDSFLFLNFETTGCSEDHIDSNFPLDSNLNPDNNSCLTHYAINQSKNTSDRQAYNVVLRLQECISGGYSEQHNTTITIDSKGKVTTSALVSMSKREGDNMFGFGGTRDVKTEGFGCVKSTSASEEEASRAARKMFEESAKKR